VPSGQVAQHQYVAAKLRSWRVVILRNRAHYLGDVQAPDEKAAEAAAIVEFNLSDDQRRRVTLSERTTRAAFYKYRPRRLVNVHAHTEDRD
jgi:hypothetical protein